ncbi:L-threonylcarbamoyladenylate synthase [Ornithinimicrobium cryptoxanthini]|uniref:L-threonylcarbamoyladenylate synthase n=1 Tax=Ornithinimicrobium cryptoxanthini TaxID=2934161 RepID=UPI003158EB54
MIVDATDPDQVDDALEQAAQVVRAGKVLVLPTDTVYGVGADAFDQVAVAMVLAAKHRGREMPPPVLVGSTRTVDGLATELPMYAKILIRHFWPGALTIVVRAQPTLAWDLGETNGTVALRMPDDAVALRLLSEVGPMAVTSANVTGQPPATTALEAQAQLGGAVALYLDGGVRADSSASTIVDCTGEEPIVLRHGALPAERLREVLGATVLHDSPPSAADEETVADGDADAAGEDVVEDAATDGRVRGLHVVAGVRPSGLPVRSGDHRTVPAHHSLQ